MVTATLSNSDVQRKLQELDGSNRLAELVIRVGLEGIRGTEIIADESDTQGKLLQLWNALCPALKAEQGRLLSDEEFLAIVEGKVNLR